MSRVWLGAHRKHCFPDDVIANDRLIKVDAVSSSLIKGVRGEVDAILLIRLSFPNAMQKNHESPAQTVLFSNAPKTWQPLFFAQIGSNCIAYESSNV